MKDEKLAARFYFILPSSSFILAVAALVASEVILNPVMQLNQTILEAGRDVSARSDVDDDLSTGRDRY